MQTKSKNENTISYFPRIMLAAPASGSGKTLVTCGLLQVLKNRNIRTAAFKCGPDYIDPMFHTRVIGVPSRNLDTFFTDAQTTRYLFGRQAEKAELSVIEGVMGFYDGIAGITTGASSWELACVTETPVILVVNARGMSLSVVPLIEGFLKFPETCAFSVCGSMIKGVILNQISASIYPDLKREIESRLPVRVLGFVPRVDDCVIESRHLGLMTPGEISDLQAKLQRLAGVLEETLDIDGMIALAQSASNPDVSIPNELQAFFEKHQICDSVKGQAAEKSEQFKGIEPKNGRQYSNRERLPAIDEKCRNSERQTNHVRIALARDKAFCFYYADNLELLETFGAELVYFSPLHDGTLPENIQGLLLGGGYPELYAEMLSKNESMLYSVRTEIGQGLPYLAECGGFMYLHQSIEDMDGKSWKMAGVLNGRAYKTERLNRFGYIKLTENQPQPEYTWLGSPDATIRAHEFHYFDSTDNGTAFHAQKPHRKRGWDCIVVGENFVAGFPHLYYYSNPEFVAHFLDVCRTYSKQ